MLVITSYVCIFSGLALYSRRSPARNRRVLDFYHANVLKLIIAVTGLVCPWRRISPMRWTKVRRLKNAKLVTEKTAICRTLWLVWQQMLFRSLELVLQYSWYVLFITDLNCIMGFRLLLNIILRWSQAGLGRCLLQLVMSCRGRLWKYNDHSLKRRGSNVLYKW